MTRHVFALACAAPLLALTGGVQNARADIIKRTPLTEPPVQLYEFSTGQARMEVLAIGALKTTEMQESNQGISVRNARALSRIEELARREMLLVNGGRSGSSSDRPDGLLRSEGRLASWLNTQTTPAEPQSACALRRVARPQLSGLLCVDEAGNASLRKINDKSALAGIEMCSHALQAGPMVVEQGRPAVCEREPREEWSHFSVLCAQGADRMAVAVTNKPMQLDALAEWLAAPKPQGLGCENAMVLNNGPMAGAMYSLPQSYQVGTRGPFFAGPGKAPVASFVVVHPKDSGYRAGASRAKPSANQR
ncbi:hypothetical protein CDN99_12985 [Roseateles aquatilis]|uniref:Phosphodiester glycosidase domain-containing protein n=1 Tax=Roseateles aquatilis TaxID=431061 RepID=A0A246JCB8_9BURK|nr:phosphodiester glycosidase family protein [Roseateles aquatilis]OWQ90283.1 hypothetical protein CDN99_12985 [Roseateles aquatilis]